MTVSPHVDYVLRLGDNALVLGHRVSEWCGHGPALEEDIALTNIALDLVGQARWLLTHAGTLEGAGRSEDDLAYFRDAHQFRNVLLVEQPNGPTTGGGPERGGDFGITIARQWLFSSWYELLLRHLVDSADTDLGAIAAKAQREVQYHHRHAAEWVIRLGDGTDESHLRMQRAVDHLWRFTGELFTADAVDDAMVAAGVGPDPQSLRPAWDAAIDEVLREATLQRPADGWMPTGGKQGEHTEHLGYLPCRDATPSPDVPWRNLVTPSLPPPGKRWRRSPTPSFRFCRWSISGWSGRIAVASDGALEVAITQTYSGCPAADVIAQDVVSALGNAGFATVRLSHPLSPPWTTDWITERGRQALLEHGIAPPGEGPHGRFSTPAVRCPRCNAVANPPD